MTKQFGSRQPEDSQSGGEGLKRRPRIRPKANMPSNQLDPVEDSGSQAPGGRFQVPDPEDSRPVGAIDNKKRSIALVFDILVGFTLALVCSVFTSLIGMMLSSFIPGINRILSREIFIVLYFLFKDRLYRGRGIGKNLMGLRVIDAQTGASCTLLQSAKRNLIFLVPFLLQFSIQLSSPLIPIPDLRMATSKIADMLGMAYVLIVIPLECYLAYSSVNGLRLGDRFAGTKVVEADMNFSSPLN